jgi:cysteine synthase A
VLKQRNPALKVVAVEPEGSPVLSGGNAGPHRIQGIGAGFVPNVLDIFLIDEVITIPDATAIDTARVLARIEGIAGGLSTGANVAAALMVATRDEFAGRTVVTFAPSAADRYLSTALFVGEADEDTGA